MFNKKIILILTIILVSLFAVSEVSAADDNATLDELMIAEDLDLESSVNVADEILGNGSGNAFSDLSGLIGNATEGDVLELDKDYKNDGSESEITISKSMTIDGKGHTIDADRKSGIFTVTNSNVTFKNIFFVNGEITDSGGAINGNCTVINCTFIGNTVSGGGGAIFNGTAINSTFINNTAKWGGACSLSTLINCYCLSNVATESGGVSSSSNVYGCIFENNTATSYYGGAVNEGFAENCIFIGNHANCGGAIRMASAVNCTFKNNVAGSGGAMYDDHYYGEYASAVNCTFINNKADEGGAVYEVSAVNCTFINNKADWDGGAMYGNGYTADNCQFTNNTAANGGATYQITSSNCEFTNNTATEYGGAAYEGTANNCIFKGNKAGISGDDAHNAEIINATDGGGGESSSQSNYTDIIPEEITSNDEGIVILEFPQDAEGTVEVFINGTSVAVVNIVNGIAAIDLSKYKGNYTVTFVYSGDDKYSGFTRQSNVTVNANTAIITAKDTKVLYTAGQKFSVTVYEDENVAAKSTPVEFKVNGKYFNTYNTNANGIASFKVTQAPGTYNVQATALEKTVTKTLIVKHIVTLKKVTVKRSAKKLVLTATLAKVNKKYLKNKKVTFKFNGKKYTAKTNKKGVAKVTIKASVLKKLKAGKKVTYQATYLKDTVKKNAKVKK